MAKLVIIRSLLYQEDFNTFQNIFFTLKINVMSETLQIDAVAVLTMSVISKDALQQARLQQNKNSSYI